MNHDFSTIKGLSEDFFHGQVTDIAEELLGKLLVYDSDGGVAGGIIVETEAYLGQKDPASHLVKVGKKRKQVFKKGAGTVYVFKIYRHCNLNFITEHDGISEGVLIRALEPIKGVELMKQRRGVKEKVELASGPGKLTEALGIKKDVENGRPIEDSNVSVYETNLEPEIKRTGRIGISEAEDWPLRFIAEDSKHLSTGTHPVTEENFSAERFY